MRRHLSGFVFWFLIYCNSSVTAQENLVVNGSFEDPAVDVSEMFNATSQGIAGWTIVNGSVDLNSTRWDPFHLDQSIDMAGVSPGTIEQLIETKVGGSFSVTFVYANNPEIFNGQSVSGFLEVVGAKKVVFAAKFSHSGSVADNMGYDRIDGCFIADSEQSILRITALDAVGGSRGIVVDDIRIQQYLLGDANLDGVINLLDVSVFVQKIEFGTFSIECDLNCDGVVDLLDVAPFVELLTGD